MKGLWTSLCLLSALPGCAQPDPPIALFEGATMGTTYSVQVVRLPPALERHGLHAELDGLLQGIEDRMSTYDPSSEVSRFNATGSSEWFAVSADTLAVIEEALRVHRMTGGAFDVTVGPLVELWGFGPRRVPERPEPSAVVQTLTVVGSRWLETRSRPPALRKHVPALRVDLSAIAKGFAVDELARRLEDRGARDFLVEVGGELRARGRGPGGRPWRVAVERPPGTEPPSPARTFELVDRAVATSGDYHDSFQQDGVRYSHVLDPRSGRPVATSIASATVLANTAMEADAVATALMVLSPEEGLRLAEREGLAARLLVRAGPDLVELCTPDFPARALAEAP